MRHDRFGHALALPSRPVASGCEPGSQRWVAAGGPNTYQIVSNTGCDVRDLPDMVSPVVTRRGGWTLREDGQWGGAVLVERLEEVKIPP